MPIRKIKASLVKEDVDAYIGEYSYLFYDIDTGDLRIYDGTPGGLPLLGAGGGVSIQLEWKFSTSTAAADPGNKTFAYNNSTLASVTAIYVNDTTNSNTDAGAILDALTSGNQIYIQEGSNADNNVLFRVTGAATDNTGWWTIPVTVEDSGTLHGNNQNCGWIIFAGAAAGGGGVPGGVDGDIQVNVAGAFGTISGFTVDANTFNAGNYTFNIDETVGAGQDNYVLTYNNSTGEIGLEAPPADQNLWLTIAADVGGPVSANTTTDTLTIAGGVNCETTISGDTVTIDVEEDVYAQQVDFVTSTLIYRAEADPGTATSAAAWRIRRIIIDNASKGDVSTTWADGNANFDNIWDNRAILSYS